MVYLQKENIMIKKCMGCGIKLQNTDKSKSGYINDLNNNLCQRCFRLKHYNEYKSNLKPMKLDKFINNLNTFNKFVVFMIDFFNIYEFSLNIFKNIKQDKILVVSKSDLIFKSIKVDKVKNFIKNYYNISEKIIFLSSFKGNNINELTNVLKKIKKDVYFVGLTNSGKSTLLNKILDSDNITTSIMPNTTLENIKIKYNDIFIYDTPGINYENVDYSNIKLHKKINTKKFIKPITYQTKNNFTLSIEDYFTIWTDRKNSFTLYCSNELNINKTFQDITESEIKINDNTDIVIKGIGFINIKKECIVKCDLNKIEIRPSIFKGVEND